MTEGDAAIKVEKENTSSKKKGAKTLKQKKK